MRYRTFKYAAALLAMVGFAALNAAQAEVTIRMLHVEQNPAIPGLWNEIARRYEAAHPGVRVELQFLEGEAYKKKLTTLLQSPGKPNIVYSWGGGVLREQVKAGAIEDLTGVMDSAWKARFAPAAIQAYTLDGKLYGVPLQVLQVGFFYNKDLFAKAGLDASNIVTWDDLLGAVRTLQAAGITPIIAGGADKWPLHFYWSHLAIRIGGKAAFEAALRGEGNGFAAETFVRAGDAFKQLADLKPFQNGFIGVTYPQSAGQFGDGKGAMMLMLNGLLGSMKANSADKIGIPDDKLGWFPFRTLAGGKGAPSDTLGGLNGWLITKDSPKETADFLRYFTEVDNHRQAAERGFYIPSINGTQDALKNPILRQLSVNVANSTYHQIFYDQMLGPSVGAVVNDVSADLASGRMTPAAAALAVQMAWQLAN